MYRRRTLIGLPATLLAVALVTMTTPSPAGADPSTTPACPSSNTPDAMSMASGSPQTTKVGTAFAQPFSVQLSNVDGCPITTGAAGVSVTFTAPPGAPSGDFSSTGTSTATVGTDAAGMASAPPFTADDTAGSYTVTATSAYGTVTFSLTSTSTGVGASITATGGASQTGPVGTTYASALEATVVDAGGEPVTGAPVTFTVDAVSGGAGATFASGGPSAMAVTNSSGIATAPPLIANDVAGTFTVIATASGLAGTATFALTNTAASPHAITAGDGSSQATAVGSAFAVPLAVTVTDTDKNPVAGITVTFAAPTTGASGDFSPTHGPTATAVTDADGVAVAPTFVANDAAGGYVVTAAVAGVSPAAAFALVNSASTAAGTAGAASGAPGASLGVLSPVVGLVADRDGRGYWLVTADGRVFTFGDAHFAGSISGTRLAAPIVGMALSPSGLGYWLVAADGGIFAFGDARFAGSAGGIHLAAPVVAMAADATGHGYWLVAADGGVFAFGDARFAGSAGAVHLVAPIVGLAADRSGLGYWLVAADGGVFAFGTARFAGSAGGTHLAAPMVGISADPDGSGYWLVDAAGGVFTYGDARFAGSGSGAFVGQPVIGMATTADGGGYRLAASSGAVIAYGDAG